MFNIQYMSFPENIIKEQFLPAPTGGINIDKNVYTVLTKNYAEEDWEPPMLGLYTGGLSDCMALCMFYVRGGVCLALGMVHGSGGLHSNDFIGLAGAMKQELKKRHNIEGDDLEREGGQFMGFVARGTQAGNIGMTEDIQRAINTYFGANSGINISNPISTNGGIAIAFTGAHGPVEGNTASKAVSFKKFTYSWETIYYRWDLNSLIHLESSKVVMEK